MNSSVNLTNQPSVLCDIEKLVVGSCNGENVNLSSLSKGMYAVDIIIDNFIVYVLMLPDMVRTGNTNHQLGISRVTSMNTVCEIFNTCGFPKIMLCEVDHLLRIYLTFPLTSSTAERTFSRCLKSCLRSSMTQKRWNHLVLLHTHHQRTDNLTLLKVLQDRPKTLEDKNFFSIFQIPSHCAYM